MAFDSRPIGVFDSGIGGLTIAHGLVEQMPSESIIYFGDTQHLPYGDKSATTVRRYSVEISRFLKDRGCKAIVIACNTASALAYDAVKNEFPELNVFNVIDPVVENVAASGYRKIGVIGTRSTIRSGIYSRKIRKLEPGAQVRSMATPLLIPMIEEGFHNKNISAEIIATYLSKPQLAEIEELILGCTHFPLIRDEINDFYQGKVALIDSPSIVAEKVYRELKASGMLSDNGAPGYEFFISDLTESFTGSAGRFFSESVSLKECRLWDDPEIHCG